MTHQVNDTNRANHVHADQANFNDVAVTYEEADIRDLKAVPNPKWKQGQKRSRSTLLVHDNQEFMPTQRFWNSFSSRFGIGDTVFNYFSHEEVFNRIAHVNNDGGDNAKGQGTTIRLTKVDSGLFVPELQALSSLDKPIIEKAPLTEIIRNNGGMKLQYHKGHVSALFTPKSGQEQIIIGKNPDEVFTARYVFESPIDGYGKPRIYLLIERLVCTNGMVARTPAFRSDVNIGDNPYDTIDRALAAYDNEEGYSAISERLVASQQSPASLKECMDLKGWLEKAGADDETLRTYEEVCGNVSLNYGLASSNAISKKRQAMLPSEATVYDLFNFASEYSTHRADQGGAIQISGWLGDTMCKEFDLEGQLDEAKTEFTDLFLQDDQGQEIKVELE